MCVVVRPTVGALVCDAVAVFVVCETYTLHCGPVKSGRHRQIAGPSRPDPSSSSHVPLFMQ